MRARFRAPLIEWSDRRRCRNLHNTQHNRWTSIHQRSSNPLSQQRSGFSSTP